MEDQKLPEAGMLLWRMQKWRCCMLCDCRRLRQSLSVSVALLTCVDVTLEVALLSLQVCAVNEN